MGCCFGIPTEDRDHLELTSTVNDAVTCKCGAAGAQVQVVRPSQKSNFNISGSGTVIGSCPLEGDTATWQVKVGDSPQNICVGIKRYNKKKPCSLNDGLVDAENHQESPAWFLKNAGLKKGDVVGVYWDQTDLPMLSFSLNGQLLVDMSVMRIRPANDIYPAVSVSGDGNCEIIFDEDQFLHPPISSKFKMIICASSLI